MAESSEGPLRGSLMELVYVRSIPMLGRATMSNSSIGCVFGS